MRIALTATSGKLLASTVVVAAAAGVAGLGTFGSFTSSTSASTPVDTGTVAINLGASGTAANRLSVAATGLVPGDTVQRAVQLTNTGNQALSSLTLTTAATTTSKLDTDTANGLQLTVQSCATPWVEAGTAPAFTYTCGTTPTTVVASRAAVGSTIPLGSLAALSGGATDNLRVTLALPVAADNTFQGLNSTVGFTFTGIQRVATNR